VLLSEAVKAAIALAIAAVAAFLYFRAPAKKIEAPPPVAIVAATPQRHTVAAPAAPGRTVDRLKTDPNAQTDLKPTIDRLKAGPNAQTDLTPNVAGRWKTGLNAQADLSPTIDRLKTGTNPQTNLTGNAPGRWSIEPKAQNNWSLNFADRWKFGLGAQTALAPTIDRLKTGPNAQTPLAPQTDRLKTGPNAQTDLTLKRSW
jgi:hypothetical protein